jgi:thiol-disulfide isomerase/thioredoxin
MDQSEPQVELTDDGFETAIHRSALPVLVEFWAEWSGGCHIMAPILGSLAKSLAGRIKVMRMNIEQCPRTAKARLPLFLRDRRSLALRSRNQHITLIVVFLISTDPDYRKARETCLNCQYC